MFLNDRSTRTVLGALAATLAAMLGVNLAVNPGGLTGNTPWTLAALVIFALAMWALNWREMYRENHPHLDEDEEAAALSAMADSPPLPIGVPLSMMYPEVTATVPQPSMPPAQPLIPTPPSPNPGQPPAPSPTPAPAEPPLPSPNEPVVPEPATPPIPDPSPEPTPAPTEPAVPPPSMPEAPISPQVPSAPPMPDQTPATAPEAPPTAVQETVETVDPRDNPLEKTQITDKPASPAPSAVTPDPRTEEPTPEVIEDAQNGSREAETIVAEGMAAPAQPDPRDAGDPPAIEAPGREEKAPINEPPPDNAQDAPNEDTPIRADEAIPTGDGSLPQGFEPLIETEQLAPINNTAPTEAPKTPDAVERQPVTAAQLDNDLTRIEGIGNYYQKALNQIGYQTFAQVASANPQDILTELLAAGFRRHPTISTWPEQAAYAARGDWDGLKAFQSTLIGGRRK